MQFSGNMVQSLTDQSHIAVYFLIFFLLGLSIFIVCFDVFVYYSLAVEENGGIHQV